MRSGEEKMSFILTREEILAITNAFEGYASEFSYFGVNEIKDFLSRKMDPVASRVYEKMIISLNLMDMLDMMDEEDPDGN